MLKEGSRMNLCCTSIVIYRMYSLCWHNIEQLPCQRKWSASSVAWPSIQVLFLFYTQDLPSSSQNVWFPGGQTNGRRLNYLSIYVDGRTTKIKIQKQYQHTQSKLRTVCSSQTVYFVQHIIDCSWPGFNPLKSCSQKSSKFSILRLKVYKYPLKFWHILARKRHCRNIISVLSHDSEVWSWLDEQMI